MKIQAVAINGFKNLSNSINFASMSDGAKRPTMILTKIIVSSIKCLSDSYLDPAWIHVGMHKTPGIAE